jgi:hypothetical protein
MDASDCVTAQLIAQTANGDVEDLCCVSSIAATGSERKNDILSYRLGECCVIFYDHLDLASSRHRHTGKP